MEAARTTQSKTPALKHYAIAAAVAVLYPLISYFLIGFKSDQLLLVLVFVSLYLGSPLTRRFIIGFSIFIVFWVLFDYMKAFPNYHYQPVHIESLYRAELHLFGIAEGGSSITPNEYWARHSTALLDLLSGLFYLCWVPVPLAFGAYLFYKDRKQFLNFALTFLLVNLIGFVFYYTYPAAPPWYVQLHGFDFIAGTPGNTAGLSRFDALFGIHLFHSMYAKSSNVFAAMPSLHSAYPAIVLYYGIRTRRSWMNIVFAIITGGIWFAAVYTSHHYILDVVAGVACAITGIVVFNLISKHNRAFSRFLQKYLHTIS